MGRCVIETSANDCEEQFMAKAMDIANKGKRKESASGSLTYPTVHRSVPVPYDRMVAIITIEAHNKRMVQVLH
jgi:hypothetical protein